MTIKNSCKGYWINTLHNLRIKKKKTFNITKNSDKKYIPTSNTSTNNETKYAKTKYSAHIKDRSVDFKKKGAEISTRTTMKKTVN